MFDDDSPIGRLEIASLDDNGDEETTHEQGIHSLLDNYYTWWGLLGGTTRTLQMTDENGTNNDYFIGGDSMDNPGGSFAVGTGTKSFSQSDFSLDSEDTRGGIDTLTIDESNQLVKWETSLTASANISVTETGWLYDFLNTQGGSGSDGVFLERTVLTSSVNTGSNGNIRITYEWDFPAP